MIWEVIEAAKTKPLRISGFLPGPRPGGHCIPLDPYYLSWRAKKYDFHISIIETSAMINDRMPEYCVERAGKILNKFKKALKGAKTLILGVAYKQDIEDYRESPALKVIDEFKKNGSIVDFYDPYVSQYKYKGKICKGIKAIDENVI
jgi:UDP-N-acetyl-D-glucosamine dehydrogenase